MAVLPEEYSCCSSTRRSFWPTGYGQRQGCCWRQSRSSGAGSTRRGGGWLGYGGQRLGWRTNIWTNNHRKNTGRYTCRIYKHTLLSKLHCRDKCRSICSYSSNNSVYSIAPHFYSESTPLETQAVDHIFRLNCGIIIDLQKAF